MARSLYARLSRRYSTPIAKLARREFLKLTLAASAGLLVSSIPAFGESSTQRHIGCGRRVIVIGGGFSGLACAHELVSAGYDVKALTVPPSTFHNIRFSPRLPRALKPQMGTSVKGQ